MLPEDPDKQAEAPVNPKELTADDPGMEAAIQELKGEPLVLQQDAAITKPFPLMP